MEEIWKDIKGFEGLYQISNKGRIRSLDRIVYNSRYGKQCLKGKILKQGLANDYPMVVLHSKGKGFPKRVSIIVYETFIGPIPKGMQVNHIDENKTNNRVDNLNLMTPKENSNWGTRNIRAANHKKIPVVQCSVYGEELFCWFSATDASEELGINGGSITACCRGQRLSAGGYIWKYKEAA